jgi:glutamate synthase (NADPH) small chain
VSESGKRKKGPPPPRVKMPEQPADERVHNFDEVPRGLSPEQAMAEAARCLDCKKPKCVAGCPVGIDIPGFVARVRDGEFAEAVRKLKEETSLPAVCGRVCPQETQCEELCILGKKHEPVAIGYLERFLADWEFEHGGQKDVAVQPATGQRVAIVGSGPAGLTCAGELAKMGYEVTVFEAFHKAGGVLVYGIPEFRLPKAIVQYEVDNLEKLGVGVELNQVIGKIETIDELFEDGYEAVFIGTGAGAPRFLGIDGENLNGVFSANEFLTRVNLMKAYREDYDTPVMRGQSVVVFGGGNVAMDSARTALRLGAGKVRVLYRRTRAEMPAREEEIHHAEQEGIQFDFLVNPLKFLGNDDGWLTGLECMRMELGEPDDSGRRRPVPVEGSEFTDECDLAVVAIGNSPNPLIPMTTPGLDLSRWGTIVAEDDTGQTSREGVFADGDIVTGAATVILAMGAGKQAAKAIDQYLTGKREPAAAAT